MAATARYAVVCCLLAAMAGCSGKHPLTVGSKNFTEQIILGEIVAQQLERRLGEKVERKLDLGGTLLAQQALSTGQIDLYPEYTGTALTAVLKLLLPPKREPCWRGCGRNIAGGGGWIGSIRWASITRSLW